MKLYELLPLLQVNTYVELRVKGSNLRPCYTAIDLFEMQTFTKERTIKLIEPKHNLLVVHLK